jgi:murein L,D-transpeptidase YafK
MTIRSYSLIGIVGAAALFLAGCNTAYRALNTKAYRPIPGPTLALMKEKGMTRRDPILVRIYKEESELEIWKKRQSDGRYALLKTYEICRWSGTLGPKKTEGDGQAPEGFYSVTPGQMNPNSQYFLAFNIGYPNAYDRSLGRSGKHLMVHGDCLSKGCYAMTDEQIAEVYAIAREALVNGQPSFQVQALPFRMTAENMARRRDDKNFAFWKNLKEGADHFELTKLEPKVDVCGHQYVFDATTSGSFNPNAACPNYEVNPAIAMALSSKERDDDQKFNELVAGGLQTAAAYTPQNGRERRTLSEPIKHEPPPVMTAQKEPDTTGSIALAMADSGNSVPMPVPSPYVSSQPKQKSGGMFTWLRGGGDKPAEKDEPETSVTPSAKPAPATVARADSEKPPVPGKPIAASLAPETDKKEPFYKRWFGKKEDEKKDDAKPAAAEKQQPAPKAAPTLKPAAPTPAPTAAAAPKPAPAPQAASAEPTELVLPPIPRDALGAAAILSTGTFQ